MTSLNRLNEFNRAQKSARRLLRHLEWAYVSAMTSQAERPTDQEALLTDRLLAALLRLNYGLSSNMWVQGRIVHGRMGLA